MTAAVLCGGRSTRFGQPKDWLDFAGRPLLQHVVHTVRPLFPRVLAVGLRPDSPPLPDDVPALHDARPGAGPMGGMVAALHAAATEHTFFFACDTPFIHPALVRAMQNAARDAQAVVPQSGPHFQPLFAIYHKSCLPIAEEQMAREHFKISSMFPHITIRYFSEEEQRVHDPDLLSFFNINTPDDYRRAALLLQQGHAPPAHSPFSKTNSLFLNPYRLN